MRWDRGISMAQVVFCFVLLVLIPRMLNRLDILLDLLLGEVGSHLWQCDRYFSGSKGALRIQMTGAAASGIFRALRVSWTAHSAKLWFAWVKFIQGMKDPAIIPLEWRNDFQREKLLKSFDSMQFSESVWQRNMEDRMCSLCRAETRSWSHGPSTLVTCVCWKMGRNRQFMGQLGAKSCTMEVRRRFLRRSWCECVSWLRSFNDSTHHFSPRNGWSMAILGYTGYTPHFWIKAFWR